MHASDDGALVASLVWLHRWLGIGTCLIFALWFASGAVMVFEPFPSLGRSDRLALMAPLRMEQVRISPAEAFLAAGAGPASDLRLIQRGGAPAYIIAEKGSTTVLDAGSGKRLPLLSASAVGATGAPIDYDQWIVPNGIDPYRPVYRIEQHDAAGTTLYVSAVTGEAVQRTTARDRAWNWLGSVLHWVYFTPLRSNWAAWDQTVWWLSFVAMFVAVAGVTLGTLRTARSLRQTKPRLTYFRVWWLRWHHLLGLFAGFFVLTWIVSGWLSMDHGRLFSRGEATEAQASAFHGTPGVEGIGIKALQRIGPAKEIGFSSLAGNAILAVARSDGTTVRLSAGAEPLTDSQFGQYLAAAVDRAWPTARFVSLERVDTTNVLRLNEGWPDTVRRVRLAGRGAPDLYVDSADGRLLTVMDGSRVAYAWVYYALHTFKFPGLAEHELARKMLVLTILAAGFAFSITGVVIGWRRVRRTVLRT